MRAIVLIPLLVAGCRSGSNVAIGPADAGAPDAGAIYAGAPSAAAVLARTCAMVVSCPLWPGEARGSFCVDDFEQGLSSLSGTIDGIPAQFQQVVDCSSAASDCAGALACLARGHGANYCLANYGQSCDGNLEVACGGSGANWTIDCAALGDECRASGTGWATCTNGVACDPLTARDGCDGNRWTRCDPETRVEASIDCATLHAGAFCGSYNGFSECIPGGPPCSGPYPLRCDGNSLVTCVAGHELVTDCTATESHCVDNGPSSACVTDATACAAGSPDQCSGDSLQICVNGHVETIDCASIGLRTCVFSPAVVLDMGGSAATAKCVP